MRIRAFVVLTALLLAPAASARAQETPTPAPEPTVGSFDVGGQFSNINGDEARYQRYKDLRTGGLLDRFNYTREKENWLFDVTGHHVGYRDQKFVAEFRNYARGRVSFTWDQIPLFYAEPDSDQFGLLSASPYQRVGPGEYRINDAVQQTLQAFCPLPPCAANVNTARQQALALLMNREAQTLDIRHRRDVALLDASFALIKNTNLLFHFQNTDEGRHAAVVRLLRLQRGQRAGGPRRSPDHRRRRRAGVVQLPRGREGGMGWLLVPQQRVDARLGQSNPCDRLHLCQRVLAR